MATLGEGATRVATAMAHLLAPQSPPASTAGGALLSGSARWGGSSWRGDGGRGSDEGDHGGISSSLPSPRLRRQSRLDARQLDQLWNKGGESEVDIDTPWYICVAINKDLAAVRELIRWQRGGRSTRRRRWEQDVDASGHGGGSSFGPVVKK